MVVSSIPALRFGPGHHYQDDSYAGTAIYGRSLEWTSFGPFSLNWFTLSDQCDWFADRGIIVFRLMAPVGWHRVVMIANVRICSTL